MAIEKDPEVVKNSSNQGDSSENARAAYRKIIDDKIDEQIDQSFPASDPPSYSEPGNDDIKPGREDIKKGQN